jgi:hypothetical protein
LKNFVGGNFFTVSRLGFCQSSDYGRRGSYKFGFLEFCKRGTFLIFLYQFMATNDENLERFLGEALAQAAPRAVAEIGLKSETEMMKWREEALGCFLKALAVE